ncbi:hypothetical protein F5Y17DRAFT_92051 [Xylariaceae sp. FL0594]|nr:hypothetical protein F5Y17DRAFT_92051 [Xylariaceae sp. FL0594]
MLTFVQGDTSFKHAAVTMSVPKEHVKISESLRERETFSHEPTLLSGITDHDAGGRIPTWELSESVDSNLTALAQLAVFRTQTSRAFISLFDTTRQFFIAEATRTSPLKMMRHHNHEQHRREFWVRGTAIPRERGVCHRFLNTSINKSINGDAGDDSALPVNMICDIHADPDLKADTCVLLRPDACGYAGVPIRSRSGIDFGQLCVITERPLPEDEWGKDKTSALREISQAVQEHLTSKACQTARGRAEKMTRGMGSFIEQRSAWVSGHEHRPIGVESEATIRQNVDDRGETNRRRSESVSPMSSPKPMNPRRLADSEPHIPRLPSAGPPPELNDHPNGSGGQPNGVETGQSTPTAAPSHNNPASIEQNPLKVVFSRSAHIIRESIEADGVVFFDANAGRFNSFARNCAISNTSDSDELDNDSDPDPHVNASAACVDQCPGTDVPTSGRFKILFKVLSALLRKHPKGAIFDFDECGNPQPSSIPDIHSGHDGKTVDGRPKLVKSRTASFIANLGNEIFKTFPGARGVAFVPVFDSVKQHAQAGCFAWTGSKTRFFGKVELNFMLAFATLAMAEIASLETDQANRAKSDVLSLLSHELRTPLHGIDGAVGLLMGTPPSQIQDNLTNLHILKSSGRTLNDTVDQLLFYAKVNNFKPPDDNPDTRPRGLRGDIHCKLQDGMKDLVTAVHVDELVEEVTESIFAGFIFQRSSIGHVKRELRKTRPYIHEIWENHTQTAEDAGWWRQDGEGISNRVFIDLAIDPGCPHYYRAIPGALRRIVMNLFGNALKFTKTGCIRVALSQEQVQVKKRDVAPWVKIVVADTGKGMSQDFLANHLFQDFWQEDENEPGLGLGLSIVKKIVTSLKGKVSIESKVGVGTTATVLLPLEPALEAPINPTTGLPELDEYVVQRRKLDNLRVRFVGFDTRLSLPSSSEAGQSTPSGDRPSIRETCRNNLHIQVVNVGDESLAPDIVLCEERMLSDRCMAKEGLFKAPLVVVCPDSLSAQLLSKDPRFVDHPGVIEFISQPTGPRKLAEAFIIALQRWVESQDSTERGDKLGSRTVGPHDMSNKVNRQPRKMPPSPIAGPDKRSFFTETATSQSRKSRPSLSIRTPPQSPESLPAHLYFPQASMQEQAGGRSTWQDVCSSSSSPPKSPTPAKFLLVDDNVVNMKFLCTYMEKLGQAYDTAEDGQVAVEKFCDNHSSGQSRYRCILMDISMPRLNGMEASTQIRRFEAENRLEPVFIFAVSGLASEQAQKNAFASGMNLFLTKPVRFTELQSILKNRNLL